MLRHEYQLWLERFTEYQKAKGLSPRTIDDRYRETKAFLLFLESEKFYNLEELSSKEIHSYRLFLLQKETGRKALHIAPGTLFRILSSIKAFCLFLYREDKCFVNPVEELEMPKLGRRLPKVLSIDEVHHFLEAPDLSTKMGIRDRAILELFYSSGLRKSELMDLKMEDVDLMERTLFVTGKGSKQAIVPFGKRALDHLKNYLAFVRPHYLHKEQENTLFLSRKGSSMSKSTVGQMFVRYSKQLGLEASYSPHMLRHSCATHLLRNGADIRLIQKLLRHENLNTTERYTHVDIEDLKTAQKKYHPREVHERQS